MNQTTILMVRALELEISSKIRSINDRLMYVHQCTLNKLNLGNMDIHDLFPKIVVLEDGCGVQFRQKKI